MPLPRRVPTGKYNPTGSFLIMLTENCRPSYTEQCPNIYSLLSSYRQCFPIIFGSCPYLNHHETNTKLFILQEHTKTLVNGNCKKEKLTKQKKKNNFNRAQYKRREGTDHTKHIIVHCSRTMQKLTNQVHT